MPKNKHETRCPECDEVRFVSKANLYYIKKQKEKGEEVLCKSCRLKGNNYRFYGKKYNTNKYYQSPTYYSWANMKTRCFNQNSTEYKRYGGRGISICDRWLDFKNFLDDMGEKPEGMTLERIDNYGDYQPDNCEWATPEEQANNTRNIDRAERFEYNGLRLTIKEWAEKIGIKRTTLGMRLQSYGWSVERALTT